MSGPSFSNFSPTARESLIDALAAASSPECARAIVDALDSYLAEDPSDRVPALMTLGANVRGKIEALRKERDEAVARAERAERALSASAAKPNGTVFNLDDPVFRQSLNEFMSGFAQRKQ